LVAIRAYVAWVKGDPETALEFARHAMENLPENDQVTRAHLLNIEGLALQYTGNLPSAIQAFQAAVAIGQSTGRSHETFSAIIYLAYINYLQGRLHQAFSLCQQALNLEHKSDQVYKRNPILAHAYGTLSLVQLEWNDLEAALISAQESVALAEQWKQADAWHFALTCLSKALCAAGNIEKAFAINQRAMQLAVYVSSWFFRLSVYNEVWLDLAKGDIAAADLRLKEIEPLVSERDKKYTFLICKVSLLDAQRQFRDVLTALEKVDYIHEQKDLNWYMMHLLPFQALAWQALGRQDEALAAIGHCLAFAEPEGYVRIFVERGTPMRKLLLMAASQGVHTEYINRLLSAFQISETSKRSAIPKIRSKTQSLALLEPLSESELNVLRLLDSSMSSIEISRELYVSVNTVRTHIRNIYAKMDVHGRIEAIQKAKEFGLI